MEESEHHPKQSQSNLSNFLSSNGSRRLSSNNNSSNNNNNCNNYPYNMCSNKKIEIEQKEYMEYVQ